MPQISLYIDKSTLKKIENAANRERVSLSKWVGRHIQGVLDDAWSKDYFNLFGSIADPSFTAPKELSYKKDARREDF